MTPARSAMIPNCFQYTAGAVCLLVLAGCSDHLPQTIPVSGRVTFDGGPMPGPGMILFVPIETAEGYIRRPGRSLFDESGAFEATSWNPGDGLVPGTYFIRLDLWKDPPTMNRPVGKSYVPDRYNNPETSPLDLIVVDPRSGSIDLGIINIETK